MSYKKTYFYTENRRVEKLFDIIGSDRCQKCNYSGFGLNFHHVDFQDKKFNFGNLIARKVSVTPEELILELEKCSLLCSNCHIKEHFDNDRFDRLLPSIKQRAIEHKECPPKVDRQKVINLFAEGNSKASIARMVGCAKSTITYIINSQLLPVL